MGMALLNPGGACVSTISGSSLSMPSKLNIRRIDARKQDARQALTELRERLSPRGDIVSEAGRRRTIEVFGEPLSPQQVVERICNDVRKRGLPALLEYTKRIDKAELSGDTIRVPADELERAHRAADQQFLATIRRIRDNIHRFQRELVPRDVVVPIGNGSQLRQRFLPLRRVGICVPGGAAAYPSTVLMTAVPAQAAGVKEIAIVAPPTPLGAYNADLLAVCHELGIKEVYRVGGAQAVAALAYGVEGIPQVDKIVGPGNLFVALAKKFVYGEVDIDSIAGPSEVVVIADDSTRADFTAADLIAQAEHAPGSGVLITWSERLLGAVEDELQRQMAELSRGELARQSLEEYGALILVSDADQACAMADEIASEHLHIATDNAEALLSKIPHAGAVFLGHYSPVALGDYAAGPSHVLPTGGTARFASGLSAADFVRSNSVIAFNREALAGVADDIRALADKEGLTAHRASVDIRLQ
jgi:histidinol dehydrogenase